MPKALHDALLRSAKRKGLTGARKNAYVYGTLHRAMKGEKGESKKHEKKERE